jgi:threonine dehydrogenase-like Zn-dependent dehydrogenase
VTVSASTPNGAYCGECDRCKRGLFNLCPQILANSVGAATPGGFAEFAAVDARTLHRLPDEVTGTHGAWVEPASVALRAVRRSEIKVGDRAIVFGAGPIGLLIVVMLRAAGHIAVVEPSQARRSKALSIGADRGIHPNKESLDEIFSGVIRGTCNQVVYGNTRNPSAIRRSLKCDPRNPAPPVTTAIFLEEEDSNIGF